MGSCLESLAVFSFRGGIGSLDRPVIVLDLDGGCGTEGRAGGDGDGDGIRDGESLGSMTASGGEGSSREPRARGAAIEGPKT